MSVVRSVVVAVVGAVGVAVVPVGAAGWSAPATAAEPSPYGTAAAPSWVPNGTVKAMVRHDDVVYLGGSFTTLTDPLTGQQVPRERVAAVDAATGVPLAWAPRVNGLVEAIAVAPEGTVYLGGDFTAVGGRPATRLAALDLTGAPVSGWSASANATVLDLHVDQESLYVGGRFGSIGGKSRPRLARLDRRTGAVVEAFNARVVGGRVVALEPSGDGTSLLLGGSFTSVGTRARGFVAGVRLDTGDVTEWAPAAECGTCYLWDLTATPETVYAAVGGPGGRVVSWDAGTGVRGWSRSGDGNVQAVDVAGGAVWAGGHFGPTFAGETRHQLAVLDAATGELLPYTLPVTGRDHPGIHVVAADADALRLAGGFTLADDPARRYAVLPVR